MAESADLAIVIKAIDEATGVFKSIGGELGGLNSHVERADGLMGGLTSKWVAGAAAVGVAGVAISGAVSILSDLASEAMHSEEVQAKFNAVLESTQGVAGVTAEAADDLATALMKVTKFDDETVKSTEAMLLTFTKIGKDVFPLATETALNMAEQFHTGPEEAAVQLGKALQDPIQGIGSLHRIGIAFTEGQKEQIKAMVEAGDVAGAQAVIMKELDTEIGGVARAAGSTAAGQLTILSNEFGNMKEELGAELLPLIAEGAKVLRDILPAATVVAKVALFVLIEPIKLLVEGFKLIASVFGTADSADGVKQTAANVAGALKPIPLAVREVANVVPKELKDAQEKVAKETEKLTRDTGRKLTEIGKQEADDIARATADGALAITKAREHAADAIAKAHVESDQRITAAVEKESEGVAAAEADHADRVADAITKTVGEIVKAQDEAAKRVEELTKAKADELAAVQVDTAQKIVESNAKANQALLAEREAATAQLKAAQDKFGDGMAQAVSMAGKTIVDAQNAANAAVEAATAALTDSRADRARRAAFDEAQQQAALIRKRGEEDAQALFKLHEDLQKAKNASEKQAIQERYDASVKDVAERRKVEDADRAFSKQQSAEKQKFEDAIVDEGLKKRVETINEERDKKIAAVGETLTVTKAKLTEGLADEKEKIGKSLADKETATKTSLAKEVLSLQEALKKKQGEIETHTAKEIAKVVEAEKGKEKAANDGLANELQNLNKGTDKKIAAIHDTAEKEIKAAKAGLEQRQQDIQDGLAKELKAQKEALDRKLADVTEHAQDERDKVRESLQQRVSDLQTELADKTAKMKIKGPTMEGLDYRDDLKDAANLMVDDARSGASGVRMKQAGQNLAAGVQMGFEGSRGGLIDSFLGTLKQAWDEVKHTFGIHSPSRVMADTVGVPLAQGVTAGLLSQESSLRDAAVHLIAVAHEAAKRPLSDAQRNVLAYQQASTGAALQSIARLTGDRAGMDLGRSLTTAGMQQMGAVQTARAETVVRVYLDSRELRNVTVATGVVNSERGRDR